MSLVTIPVRIEHGRVIPKEGGVLPEQGEGVLTIVSEADSEHGSPFPAGETPPPPMTKEEADAFFAKWAGAFELRTEGVEGDPKLAYLLKKYCT